MNSITKTRTYQEQNCPFEGQCSPFAATADTLLDNGFTPLPIGVGTKLPSCNHRPMTGWQQYSNASLQEEHASVFASWSRAALYEPLGVGVLLGDGLLCVDVDSDDHRIISAVKGVLDQYDGEHVRRVGSKGFAAFVRVPEGVRFPGKISLTDGGGIDLLADGRQAVIPPTIHPDTGRPYVYISDRTLEDADIDDLPLADADFHEKLIAALESLGVLAPITSPKIQRNQRDGDGTDNVRTSAPTDTAGYVNFKAMEDLSKWIPDLNGLDNLIARGNGGYVGVALWRSSGSGRPLEKRKRNLSASPLGIKDFGTDETFTPIDLVMRSEGVEFQGAVDWLWERVGFKTEPFAFPSLKANTVDAPQLPVTPKIVGGTSLDSFFGGL